MNKVSTMLRYVFFTVLTMLILAPAPVFSAPDESKFIPCAGDYDGNGYDDPCVYYADTGSWFIWYNSNGTLTQQEVIRYGWGQTRAVPADYDGDGKTDIAVYAPEAGTWLIRNSSSRQTVSINWGWSEVVPVPRDYNGDGRDDIAVFYPADGSWLIRLSASETKVLKLGFSAVIPVPADYNGDGRDDIAVYIPNSGTWIAVDVLTGQTIMGLNWGWSGARPAPADYSGDGLADPCVYADGKWLINFRNGTTASVQWGGGDVRLVPGHYRSHTAGYIHAQAGVYFPAGGTWALKEIMIDFIDPWVKYANMGWNQAFPPPCRQ